MGMYQSVSACYGIKTTWRTLESMSVVVDGKTYSLACYVHEFDELHPGWFGDVSDEDGWVIVGHCKDLPFTVSQRIVTPGVQQMPNFAKTEVENYLIELGFDSIEPNTYIVVTW